MLWKKSCQLAQNCIHSVNHLSAKNDSVSKKRNCANVRRVPRFERNELNPSYEWFTHRILISSGYHSVIFERFEFQCWIHNVRKKSRPTCEFVTLLYLENSRTFYAFDAIASIAFSAQRLGHFPISQEVAVRSSNLNEQTRRFIEYVPSISYEVRFRNRPIFSIQIYGVTSINDHIDREPITEPICETSHFSDDRSFRICQNVDDADPVPFHPRNPISHIFLSDCRPHDDIFHCSSLLKVSASPIIHS